MVLGPRCAGCAGDPRRRPAQRRGRRGLCGRGGGGPGSFPFLPRTPGLFNKSSNSPKSLYAFTYSYPESLRGEWVGSCGSGDPATCRRCGWRPRVVLCGLEGGRDRMMSHRGCLIRRTCKLTPESHFQMNPLDSSMWMQLTFSTKL